MRIENDNPKVYLDISIAGQKIGRIVAELFEDVAPKASKNFLELCTPGQTLADGTNVTLKGNTFNKVIKNFMIQSSGIDVEGYFTEPFQENLGTFEDIYNLSMANTTTFQFFINTYPAPHLNGHHTIFGKILKGKSTVRTIEYSTVDSQSVPTDVIKIDDCGRWTEDLGVPVYNASYDTIGGDIYEEYPDDDENFDKEKPAESLIAINKIKDSGSLLFKVKNYQEALFKYKKALRYTNELIPDRDSEPELAPKFEDMKKKLFLNLSLTSLNLKDYKRAIDYSTYLLESEFPMLPTEKAKGYYRRGISKGELGKINDALEDLQLCSKLNPKDEVVKTKIHELETKLEQQKAKEKAKYSKFFGGK